MVDKVKVDSFDITFALDVLGIQENEEHANCAYDDCSEDYGFNLNEVITKDNKRVCLYFCKECERISYYVIDEE